MSSILNRLAAVSHYIQKGGADIPNVKPEAPNGKLKTGFETILGWGSWIVMGICALAIFMCAARMAMAHKSGSDGGQHLMGLIWIVVAAILVGSGAAAINAVT